MEVAGPLGTPLGLAQRKRASPRGEAGTSGSERSRVQGSRTLRSTRSPWGHATGSEPLCVLESVSEGHGASCLGVHVKGMNSK